MEAAAQIPLPVFAEQVIGGMVITYRMNAPLLRAMHQFVQGRVHTPFWRKATRLETRSYERVVELFLSHRAEIRHPDPVLRKIMREAYSHEVISAGWWPGTPEMASSVFYCYAAPPPEGFEIGRASCRERVCQYV